MTDGIHPLVALLVRVCAEKGVREFIIAPGSRSAPLTVALARHPEIRCRVVYDERSAGYIALGLAQQLRRPVGLVCTSGTAAVNFGPAVVEAYYQRVPLLVLTADRPPEWIDQQDNQAIHQPALYAPHVRGSFVYPIDDRHTDTRWYAARLAAQAIDLAQDWEPGPVHIDVPLREPLYAASASLPNHGYVPRVVHTMSAAPRLDDQAWSDLLAEWQRPSRKLIVAGLHPFDPELHAALDRLCADPSVALFADITSNLHGLPAALPHADVVLGTRDPATLDALLPDLVVNFGGQVTSKYLRQLLRRRVPAQLWHVRPGLPAPDTFQGMTHAIPMQPAAFFEELAIRATTQATASGYAPCWQALEGQAHRAITDFLSRAPFGEFRAVLRILESLPAGAHLQVGNSMAIRYANFIGAVPGHLPGRVNGNRGTSGIDGTVSTAVGAALAGDTLTTLIVGDLGFFYDRNGLWHQNVPANLRIVLLNNHGGGIFDIIDGPDQLPPALQSTYFLTPQPLTARRTAEDHGLAYVHAEDDAALCAALPAFFAPGDRAALLEVESSIETNSAVFREFKALIGELKLHPGCGAAESPNAAL